MKVLEKKCTFSVTFRKQRAERVTFALPVSCLGIALIALNLVLAFELGLVSPVVIL
jgi:hypothetical protein